MTILNQTEQTDILLEKIAEYACSKRTFSEEAYTTARYVLADTLGCGILALRYPECVKLLGPVVPGTIVPGGSRVPGTPYVLDPVRAAFNIGTMIRWLDYNDTWLAAEWGHPSDNVGGILAVSDYISQACVAEGKKPLRVKDLLDYMIKAHEIQGVLALENSLNRVGLDHVLFVKVATTAVTCAMMGGTKQEVINAVSHAWIDNSSLRTYRHTPNTGSRKSWAAGDATSRGVFLAMTALKGEMGYQTALSAPGWGFQDVLFKGKELVLTRELDDYVMKNILFKVSFPAEFHAQTAAECAIELHPDVVGRFDEIDTITIQTHESAIRIIDKKGPLTNPADRDHCLQYITAIALLKGSITADDYEQRQADDKRVDELRSRMHVVESKDYTLDYLNPDKRSIANAVQVIFKDGTETEQVEREYPLGHRFRREEAIPHIERKFEQNLQVHFAPKQYEGILEAFSTQSNVEKLTVPSLIQLFIPS